MIVYHGSTVKVEYPDVLHSRVNLDFGKGFYVTSIRTQAENWALRRSMRSNATPLLNIYKFDALNKSSFRIRTFADDRDWLDFVCACRRGVASDDFDIVIGKVADDKVYNAIDMYYRGLWDDRTTIEAIKYYPRNDQYCFVSQEAIEALLIYKETIEVQDD